MVNGYENGFRFDILGTADEFSDGLPEVMEDGTPVLDGSTAYEVDTMKFYIFYKGEWYLQAETEGTQEGEENE